MASRRWLFYCKIAEYFRNNGFDSVQWRIASLVGGLYWSCTEEIVIITASDSSVRRYETTSKVYLQGKQIVEVMMEAKCGACVCPICACKCVCNTVTVVYSMAYIHGINTLKRIFVF